MKVLKMIDTYPTAESVTLLDAELHNPPTGAKKLLLLTKYGILTIGVFDPDSHVAWGYLPKIPQSVKDRLYCK